MKGLPALIERLALDRAIEGRPDLLREGDGAAHLEAAALAARLGVDVDLARAASTDAASATLPAGVRLGRLAFSPALQAALAAGEATVPPRLFRLPETKKALMVFFAKRTGFGGGGEEGTVAPAVDDAFHRFFGFRVGDVADDCLAVRDRDATTYAVLLSLEFDLAIARRPEIAAPHPRYPRLARGLLGALLILAELERLRGIVAALAGDLADGSSATGRNPPNSRELVRLLLGETSSTSLDNEALDAVLADTPFHVETLLWQVAAGPSSIDFDDKLLAMLAGREDTLKAQRFPESHKRLASMLKNARSMRPNKGGKTMPIALARYMGLDLLDTATVGLIEIAQQTTKLSNSRTDKGSRPAQYDAFWTLFVTLLTNVAPHVVPGAKSQSLRGPARSRGQKEKDIEKGEARFRRANETGGLIDVYLPPAGTPVGGARFLPGHWLDRDRHHDWSRRIVRDFRGGAHGGLIDALPAVWKPSILARIAALRRMLREIENKVSASGEATDDLTASTLAALLPAMTPLTSDPLLHFVLQGHRKNGSGAWLRDRVTALRVVHIEQETEGGANDHKTGERDA
ncbi:hypothetical protein E2E30_04885 [Sphingomonas sp. AAP5]|uniref:hypothetical protein n=1 Tax=Sphingomonas sp. AAP5 TaxID=1523415 RepID=UPI0010572158|nr:hypothetical protein [Sphingomonas sp. AAP5]QBM75165.1 hypothetical protein E2E30_04885 [Sphingomonas sp. AAP5]